VELHDGFRVSQQIEKSIDGEVGLAEDRTKDGALEVARVDGTQTSSSGRSGWTK
jgi:hypothetical protein